MYTIGAVKCRQLEGPGFRRKEDGPGYLPAFTSQRSVHRNMFTPLTVFIEALWVLGLAGALATFSYMAWYRGLHSWSWRFTFSVPRFLVPLSFSLALFCTGMALNGVIAYQPAPWWQTAAWSVLAILFVFQLVLYGRVGRQKGWDAPIEGNKKP